MQTSWDEQRTIGNGGNRLYDYLGEHSAKMQHSFSQPEAKAMDMDGDSGDAFFLATPTGSFVEIDCKTGHPVVKPTPSSAHEGASHSASRKPSSAAPARSTVPRFSSMPEPDQRNVRYNRPQTARVWTRNDSESDDEDFTYRRFIDEAKLRAKEEYARRMAERERAAEIQRELEYRRMMEQQKRERQRRRYMQRMYGYRDPWEFGDRFVWPRDLMMW
uniref:Uncharacterized protein n=1 Tax=Hanusia phi TaxID=3032 RepID=A0A7S0EU90_9CRYP|mmetsp:Transcript_29620/g.67034  ORF Transcript_29620/g.67034 Transcript_29620/m.67034 type:complete len:217 (+) Transcript_29620:101-751(+)|eukprot:763929-Hanusia_phi.AAC.4